MKYLPHIDGIRTLAVIPVIAFHVDEALLPNGFLGVDVFFVISGYLITSIIYGKMLDRTFSFRDFWIRRIRRILPVVGTMVVATLISAALLGFAGSVGSHAKTGIASILMVANFYMPLNFGDYWGASAERSAFFHMWSLAVEEQFYLFFPLMLFYIHRYAGNCLRGIVLWGSIASFLLFVILSIYKPVVAFYMLPARIWELGFGALLALWGASFQRHSVGELGACAGFFLLLLAYTVPVGNGLSIINAVAAVAGACALIIFGSSSKLGRLILCNRTSLWIGKLSFSLYIWHIPLFVLADEFGLAAGIEVSDYLLLVCLVIVSTVSYYCIEQPVRRAKAHIAFPLLFPTTGIVVALSFVFLWDYSTDSPAGYEKPSFSGPFYDLSPTQPAVSSETLAKRRGVSMRERPDRDEPLYLAGGMKLDYGDKGRVLLIGDSHALMWSETFESIAKENGLSLFISGFTATHPYYDFVAPSRIASSERADIQQRRMIASKRREIVELWKPDIVVVANRSFVNDDVMSDFTEYFSSRAIPLLFLSPPPVLDFGNNGAHHILEHVVKFRKLGTTENIYIRATEEHQLKLDRLKSYTEGCNNCIVFEPAAFLSKSNQGSLVATEGRILYYDDDHLSVQGTEWLSPFLEEQILKTLTESGRPLAPSGQQGE